MSRKGVRAAKGRRQRASSTTGSAHAVPDVARVAVPARPMSTEDRFWSVLLTGGAAFTFLLLGRQVSDIYVDRNRALLRQNDIYSALASIAMLVIIGVIAYNRSRGARARNDN